MFPTCLLSTQAALELTRKSSKPQYLGTWITRNNDQTTELRARIEIARKSFVKLKTDLCNTDLKLKLRVRALRCYVFSVLQYELEGWTLKQEHINKLQSF